MGEREVKANTEAGPWVHTLCDRSVRATHDFPWVTPEARAEAVNSQEIYRGWGRVLWPGEQCYRSDQTDGYGIGQERGTNLVYHTVTVFTCSHFHP